MQLCSESCQSKTSHYHQPVSLFAIISIYPTAHKGLPKFQWQQRHFSLYKAKLSFLQSNNYCTAPHPTLKHEPNCTVLQQKNILHLKKLELLTDFFFQPK